MPRRFSGRLIRGMLRGQKLSMRARILVSIRYSYIEKGARCVSIRMIIQLLINIMKLRDHLNLGTRILELNIVQNICSVMLSHRHMPHADKASLARGYETHGPVGGYFREMLQPLNSSSSPYCIYNIAVIGF